MKLIKGLLITVVVLLIIVTGVLFIAINRIDYTVDSSDLPVEAYEAEGNLLTLMQNKAFAIVLADEEDSYSLIEDFLNLLILNMIKKDINEDYDPLNGETAESGYIFKHQQFTLDYIFAKLNEDDQIVVTVSLKRLDFPKVDTALHFYFDIDYDFLRLSLNLTLDKVYLHDVEISYEIYDYFVSLGDKTEVEDMIDKGELDLDDYSYSINFLDIVW